MGLWGGRFTEPADETLRALNDSIGFDKRMWRQDILGSIAYARAIARAGVISDEEAETIIDGLNRVYEEFETDTFSFKAGDEDIHTAVERRLTELVGAAGGKLHTGRSRNDQVATDLRMWTRDALSDVDGHFAQFQEAVVTRAEQYTETLMPGYTHLQPAQPITVAHWLMSFFWMIDRDRQRIADAQKRINEMPLGSGALAGHPFGIDRRTLADDLEFASYTQNSLDAVSDRDFVVETLFTLALAATHLSRLAEDIIIYSNPAFGFVTLNDRYSTGSSLMPQKRNADPMELARGKASRLTGHVMTMLGMLKGLPSSYNKDLQEDKEALFDAIDTITQILPVITAIVHTLQLNPAAMEAALMDDMLATDVADYLVRKGLPFRDAHHVVGQLVTKAGERGVTLRKLSLEDFTAASTLFDTDIYDVFDFSEAVRRKDTPGGTGPSAVREQISRAKQRLR